MRIFLTTLTLVLAGWLGLYAQRPAGPRQWQTSKPVNFELRINSESGVFRKGETAQVKLCFLEPAIDTLTVRIFKNNMLQEEKKICPVTDFEDGWQIQREITLMEDSFEETCAVYAELSSNSSSVSNKGIGIVVAPEGFHSGYNEPKDLMSWWNTQKKQLYRMPMNLKAKELEVPEQYKDLYICQDIEADCLGPAPMRAYFAKPVAAKKKSLPIVILCRAAGVSGDWCRCQVGECVSNAALGSGALSLDLNAHGMENGHDTDYYKELEQGKLKDYWDQGIESRDTYYFRGMYLRLLRAIQFMTQQPEWDGKRILVIGESQGGGQAAAIAGLDQRVSAVVLNVPAMMDFGGATIGRRSAWPHPIESHEEIPEEELEKVLPYFDASLLLKHSKAEIYCEIGLIDTTCPPSAVLSGINNAPGKKTVNCVPFRSHSWPSGDDRQLWDEKYYHPRLKFINEYLK